MPLILDAKPVVEQQLAGLKKRCQALLERKIVPSMKVILVGENSASLVYVAKKKQLSEDIGARCDIIHLSENASEDELRSEIAQYASDSSVHGLFVQLPLPQHLQHLDLGLLIPSDKDVDGFTPKNLYSLLCGGSDQTLLPPCTPKGIMTLLNHYGIDVAGKKVAVIGRSLIVGKPMAMMLTNSDATVTLCHSRTKELEKITTQNDILIVAIGRAEFLEKKHLRTSGDQIIIDVGMNRNANGKLCGDVNFNQVAPLCQAISPVPGGVGQMTVLSLIDNLLRSAENSPL
jgi:methylenetetrahydrofolate dehydrogenase (NADP+)/methenyltetrahydrofolate cyclohydrolase